MTETTKTCNRTDCRWCGDEGHPFCSGFCRERWRDRHHAPEDGSHDHDNCDRCRPDGPPCGCLHCYRCDPVARLISTGVDGEPVGVHEACAAFLERMNPDDLDRAHLAAEFVSEYGCESAWTEVLDAVDDYVDRVRETEAHIAEIRGIKL